MRTGAERTFSVDIWRYDFDQKVSTAASFADSRAATLPAMGTRSSTKERRPTPAAKLAIRKARAARSLAVNDGQ
jgi:hypothetical protein